MASQKCAQSNNNINSAIQTSKNPLEFDQLTSQPDDLHTTWTTGHTAAFFIRVKVILIFVSITILALWHSDNFIFNKYYLTDFGFLLCKGTNFWWLFVLTQHTCYCKFPKNSTQLKLFHESLERKTANKSNFWNSPVHVARNMGTLFVNSVIRGYDVAILHPPP